MMEVEQYTETLVPHEVYPLILKTGWENMSLRILQLFGAAQKSYEEVMVSFKKLYSFCIWYPDFYNEPLMAIPDFLIYLDRGWTLSENYFEKQSFAVLEHCWNAYKEFKSHLRKLNQSRTAFHLYNNENPRELRETRNLFLIHNLFLVSYHSQCPGTIIVFAGMQHLFNHSVENLPVQSIEEALNESGQPYIVFGHRR